ncbi:glucose-6-phosphate dehydrogenase [Pseudalkalibacillus hwajinpoensis]|uniref:Glucose-6-phosphate 1-dehydrogenase n=1 Tax=Guptibacillus hwajinpoensis TaxID=208199 RepID=A0A4U1MM63_9BACL|nr:glucose-6-phosphate dehydrogenase [Pseudalkalibacillus hwajinpoensis]TKD72017.1 glucose-6-phosphate dehydrogenase [Pseudalkalibacillus hwajinpoensis]
MNQPSKQASVIVIFGATGDLAKRKLFPSLYNLYCKGVLAEDFAVVGVARRQLSNEEFRSNVHDAVVHTACMDKDDKHKEFSSHFFYQPFDVTKKESYQDLKGLTESLDEQFDIPGNRIFYMAMAPEFFGTIALNLDSEGLLEGNGFNRLVIEKPFGHDFPSAQKLNDEIRQVFSEEEIYRIDHYLGKEMVQNIEAIRFANSLFEPLWNNRYISNIQITSSETVGVETRGGYYEKSGALRDMVQNHMLQMVSLLAMEPPGSLTTEEIRGEKVKVLRALRAVSTAEVNDYFVRGQYKQGEGNGETLPGYREEDNVDEASNTETFVAAKLMIDNFRWAGVPFYIRTGKRMTNKTTNILIEFKDMPMNLYKNESGKLGPNILEVHIQPEEGITLHLNVKDTGDMRKTTPIELNFNNKQKNNMNSPEAYERLLHDVMKGDATNFARWDEVALSWQFIDPISVAWANEKEQDFPNYPAGSMGPEAADKLLEKDNLHWWSSKE